MCSCKVVTTFPENAFYADAFLRTFDQFWPVSALVYYEGESPSFESAKVEYRPLDELQNRKRFLESYIPTPLQDLNKWMWDARRFCHKVFAQLDALEDSEKLIWLDADVITKKEVPIEFLEKLLEGVALVHLGRSSFSECGFVGFNQTHPTFKRFYDRYRLLYEERLLFELDAWTDCHAFDFARKGSECRDLTPGGKGFEHVWDRSVLAQYMEHLKGPKRKIEFYRKGGIDRDEPIRLSS